MPNQNLITEKVSSCKKYISFDAVVIIYVYICFGYYNLYKSLYYNIKPTMIKLILKNMKIENEELVISLFDNSIKSIEISKIKTIYLKKSNKKYLFHFFLFLLFVATINILNTYFEIEITIIIGLVLFLIGKKTFSEIIEHELIIKEINNNKNELIVLKNNSENVKKVIVDFQKIQFEKKMNN